MGWVTIIGCEGLRSDVWGGGERSSHRIPGDVSKPTTLSSKISHICVSELSTQRCQGVEGWGIRGVEVMMGYHVSSVQWELGLG